MEVEGLNKEELKALISESVNSAITELVQCLKKEPEVLKSDWVPYKIVLEKLGVTYWQWNQVYQYEWTHRASGKQAWIHWPSVEKWMEENAINKNKK